MKKKEFTVIEGDVKKDIPAVLYKYRNWKSRFHSRILTNDEIYFASPIDCNDPFDCRIVPNFIKRSKKEIRKYQDRLAITHFEETEKSGLNVAHLLKDLDNKMKDINSYQKENDEKYFQEQDKYYGIFCLSSKWNSILMWSHYSNNHKGFCVGLKGEYLISLGASKGGKVFYERKYPGLELKALKDMTSKEQIERSIIETHTKAKEWKYEDEYRVFKNFYGIEEKKIIRTSQLPPNSIVEIVLGILISKSDKRKILKIAKQKGIPVYQAEKVPFRFKIRKVQIQ